MEKMTYVKALEIAIASVADAEVKEKLEALKAQREKAEADKALRDEVIASMVVGTDYKTADIVALVDGIKSTQYAVGIMKPLVEDGSVTKATVKGATIYRLAVVDGE